MRKQLALALSMALAGPALAVQPQVFWTENFDGAQLNPSTFESGTLDQGAEGDYAGPGADGLEGTDDDLFFFLNFNTHELAGWTVDSSGVWTSAPGNEQVGVKEWEGWSFANRAFWVTAAGDQRRSAFSLASGNVAVADPDEWDDKSGPDVFGNADRSPADNVGDPNTTADDVPFYNALMTTDPIAIPAGVPAGLLSLEFVSSWRPEAFDDGDNTNNQTGVIQASYDGGATWIEVHRRDSDPASPFYLAGSPSTAAANDPANIGLVAENQFVTVGLQNPAGATSVEIRFGLLNAGNDWWWAVDNLSVGVPEPTSLVLLGAAGVGLAARRRR